jgi:hypothetical protein
MRVTTQSRAMTAELPKVRDVDRPLVVTVTLDEPGDVPADLPARVRIPVSRASKHS